mmetsp:Transcript_31438/g.30788  ORF Transcript_31438/g.30788 Transcript_31438/m.30788 type:complete len:105 (+) Transcript_31438:1266-1580(+)
MFGNQNIANSDVSQQIKLKKYSIPSQNNYLGDLSYYSNATTKDQSNEIERFNKIMSEPIENLINNLSSYSKSSTKLGAHRLSAMAKNSRARTAYNKTKQAYGSK